VGEMRLYVAAGVERGFRELRRRIGRAEGVER